MRTFEEVWQDIKKLEGQDVVTLDKRNRNHIGKINEKGLSRYSDAGKGNFTLVEKSAFQRVWNDLTVKGSCIISNRWKIACACIALLPEVEYSLRPGVIWLTNNRHEFGKLKERHNV